jgi:hypothetical protein
LYAARFHRKIKAEIRTNAGAIVTQYTYDDIIEAYGSSDENGNFFKSYFFTDFRNNYHSAVGFSVPVDASNTYVDFRIGNKVYVKLKNQYTDINYGSLRIGGIYVNSYNEGAVGRLSQNDYKMYFMPPVLL